MCFLLLLRLTVRRRTIFDFYCRSLIHSLDTKFHPDLDLAYLLVQLLLLRTDVGAHVVSEQLCTAAFVVMDESAAFVCAVSTTAFHSLECIDESLEDYLISCCHARRAE